jgi:hypothetical protein
METGDTNYVAQINRRNPNVGRSGELSQENKDSVMRALRYFFERLPLSDNEYIHEDSDDTTIAFYRTDDKI